MHVHILGICGTFMGGIAVIAKNLGFRVTGSDLNVYPPMSTMLESHGIEIIQGYDVSQLKDAPDLVIIGNAMKRTNPCVEYILDNDLPYTSGPEWLKNYVLNKKKVLAVAGTHGKTTTASILSWILEFNGYNPSFLVGGVLGNFGVSARITDSKYFVIEADEYDCAFFDKRSKFVHYRPYVQILNNLEYDHADIFENIDAIKKQFHHLVRIIPSSGDIVIPSDDKNIADVIQMGCWSHLEEVGNKGSLLSYSLTSDDASSFNVLDKEDNVLGEVKWSGVGIHNIKNALMAIKAAEYIGISVADSIKALSEFVMPKRRMELKGEVNGIKVFDDFAHHPTAIKTTIDGLRRKVGKDTRIVAVFEPRSNTMKLGVNNEELKTSFEDADSVYMYASNSLSWDADALGTNLLKICHDFDEMVKNIAEELQSGDVCLVMSNGGFNGIYEKLLNILEQKSK
jgi:UDP-N-acetylmuramate: L-alanyl-gamma-D-glutamyl-meso-diaminopimelate ligase